MWGGEFCGFTLHFGEVLAVAFVSLHASDYAKVTDA